MTRWRSLPRRGARVLVATLLVGGLMAAHPAAAINLARSPIAAGSAPQVSIASISGDHGHAFVFAQVTDSVTTSPAPPGISLSPYYSRWQAIPIFAPSCPWVWAVFVYDRATNRQLNAPPKGAPAPNFRTTTVFCPTPRASPVAAPRLAIAQARLDLDLATTIAPRNPAAGTAALLTAALSSAVTDDLSLLLSIAIDDWRIDTWRIEWGDGQTRTIAGQTGTTISTPHAYSSTTMYVAHVVATISGYAQAADYGRLGEPFLIRRPFSVQVGNSLAVTVSGRPAVGYLPPVLNAGVSPTVHGSGIPAASAGLHHLDAPRGLLVDVYLRPVIAREAMRTISGRWAGWGRTSVVSWRYLGSPSRAPDRILPAPGWLSPAIPLQFEWDAPDPVVGASPRDYVVDIALQVHVRYDDGTERFIAIQAGFTVTVGFTAQIH